MNWPRLTGAVLALALHAGIFYAFLTHSGPDALAEGSGTDNLNVVATVRLESGDLFTQEASQAAPEATAAKPDTPEPQKEEKAKEEEKKAEIPEKVDETAPAADVEKAPDPPTREKQQPTAQTASAATAALEEQRASEAVASRRTKIWSAYQLELYSVLERHKLRPHAARVGQVLVQVTIAPSGQLIAQSVLKSSGFPELDRAAVASIEKASPFPPIPREVGAGPLTLTVPFQYQTR